MNKITNITRIDIFDLLKKGIFHDLDEETHILNFYGRLENELNFLERLYNLEEMPSEDSRFKNAKEDIVQHTIKNNDYSDNWVYIDKRFDLLNCSDYNFIAFINEIFHPEVRNEKGFWKEFLHKFNDLLKQDRFEFKICEIISGRPIYMCINENQIITFTEISYFIELFNRGGYILDFSTPQFNKFTLDSVGLSLCDFYGLSKGKSFESFIYDSIDSLIFKLLFDLFEYYEIHYEDEINTNKQYKITYKHCKKVLEKYTPRFNDNYGLQEIKDNFSNLHITNQIDIMIKMQKENPTESIGKAKELIESTCKTILNKINIELNKNDDINSLINNTLDNLKIKPDYIPDTCKASKAIKALLGNLRAISTNIATIRNEYGSGHGKDNTFKSLEERHAKLAVGSTLTLVNFLWDSYFRIYKGK